MRRTLWWGSEGGGVGCLFAERTAAGYHARFHFEETMVNHRDVCFMLGRVSRVADWPL